MGHGSLLAAAALAVPAWRLAQWHYEVGRANWTLGNEKLRVFISDYVFHRR